MERSAVLASFFRGFCCCASRDFIASLWLIVPIMERNARIALECFMHFQIIIINPKSALGNGPPSYNKGNNNNDYKSTMHKKREREREWERERANIQVPFGFAWTKSFKFIVRCISRPALLISRHNFWHYPLRKPLHTFLRKRPKSFSLMEYWISNIQTYLTSKSF